MTKKDFKLIAEVLRKNDYAQESQFSYLFESLAESFADALATTNPRFDRERFLAACLSAGKDKVGR